MLANVNFISLPVLFIASFGSFNLHYSTMFCISEKQTLFIAVTCRHLQTVKVETKHRSKECKKSLLLQNNCIGPTCVRGCRIKFVVKWQYRPIGIRSELLVGICRNKRDRNLQAWVDCSACRYFRLHRPPWYSVLESPLRQPWKLAPWIKKSDLTHVRASCELYV